MENACRNISAALAAVANITNLASATLLLSPGTYTCASAPEPLAFPLTIRAASMMPTTVSCPVLGAPLATTAALSLQGLSFVGGSSAVQWACTTPPCTLNISNCSFRAMTTSAVQAAVLSEASAIVIANSTFAGNTAPPSGPGGALSVTYMVPCINSLVSVSTSIFSANNASLYGGAISVVYQNSSTDCDVALADNAFYNNNILASEFENLSPPPVLLGGAVAVVRGATCSTSSVSVHGDTYINNAVVLLSGGGITLLGGAVCVYTSLMAVQCDAVFTGTVFRDNHIRNLGYDTSRVLGGAVALYHVSPADGCNVNITDCQFIGNTNVANVGVNNILVAGGAVAVFMSDSTSSFVSVLASTFVSNMNSFPNFLGGASTVVLCLGGAVSVLGTPGTTWRNTSLAVSGCTFTSNGNSLSLTSVPGVVVLGMLYGGAISLYADTVTAASVSLTRSQFSMNENFAGSTEIVASQFIVPTLTSQNYGGAVALTFLTSLSSGVITVSNSEFDNHLNNAEFSGSNAGGALSVQGAVLTATSVSVHACVFTNNTNTGGNSSDSLFLTNFGGALSITSYHTSNSTVSITSTAFMSSSNNIVGSFSSNLCTNYGGACSILFLGLVENTLINLLNSTAVNNFNQNYCNGSPNINSGGAIAIVFNETARNTVIQSALNVITGNSNTVSSNVGSAFSYGGGVSVDFTGWAVNVSVSDVSCSYTNNSNSLPDFGVENYGGAVNVGFGSVINSSVVVRSSLFSQNSNSILGGQRNNTGGGLSVVASDSATMLTVSAESSTFVSNINLVSNNGPNEGTALTNAVLSVNMGAGFAVVLASSHACNVSVTSCAMQSNANQNIYNGNANVNWGAGLFVQTSLTSLSSTSHVSVFNASFDGNSNVNTFNSFALNPQFDNINSGAAVHVTSLSPTSSSWSISQSSFSGNWNLLAANNNNNNNYGGAVSVVYSGVATNCSLSVDATSFAANANIDYVESSYGAAGAIANTNQGGALSVVCQACVGLHVSVSACAFAGNNNTMHDGLATNSNFGAAVSMQLVSAAATSVALHQITCSRNVNAQFDSLASSVNAGGAVYVSLGAGNTTQVTISQSTLTLNNNTDVGGAVVAYGASLAVMPPNILALQAVVLQYASAFPSHIINNDNADKSCVVPGVACSLACVAPQYVDGLACVDVTHSSPLTVSECAGIGIGVGFGMLVVVAAVMVWGRCLLARVRGRYEREKDSLHEKLLSTDEMRSHLEMEVNFLRKAWDISWGEVVMQHVIGRGAFGTVYRAVWRDMPVAVKTVDGSLTSANGVDVITNPMTAELDHEVSLLQTVRHPNIVLFFGGGSTPDGAPFLVTELMELGSLSSYLTHTRSIPWPQKFVFALDTARGMAHVHGLGRMHRDLKSGNLLVSTSLHVKVADFGTATISGFLTDRTAAPGTAQTDTDTACDRVHTARTKGVGTPLWMAPELLASKPYGPAADVYSYGIVLWEIAAQTLPWEHVREMFLMNALLQRILAEERPAVDPAWPAAFTGLMTRAWVTDANARPTFATCCAVLEQ